MVTRRQKEDALGELEEKFRRAESVIVADFQGLTVSEISKLRRMTREAGVDFKVAKNTLVALAAQRAGVEGIGQLLVGPSGLAFGYQDPVSPAKILREFAAQGGKRELLPFKGGYLQGRVLSASDVKALAALPSREELLSQMLGAMQGPIAGFQRVLVGNLRGLAVALSRIAEQKSGAA